MFLRQGRPEMLAVGKAALVGGNKGNPAADRLGKMLVTL